MKSNLRAGFALFVLLTLLTGVVYPLAITLIAQTVFPHRANGSILERGAGSGRSPSDRSTAPIGSELIGQTFDDPRYFWGRPSATEKVPYNAASSGGSNLGPTNPDQLKAVKERIEKIRQSHPDQTGAVPNDLVTASASGLDPHISPAAADYQVARVAKARGIAEERVDKLVAAHTEGRTLGILGEPRVNVLKLNLALDGISANAK